MGGHDRISSRLRRQAEAEGAWWKIAFWLAYEACRRMGESKSERAWARRYNVHPTTIKRAISDHQAHIKDLGYREVADPPRSASDQGAIRERSGSGHAVPSSSSAQEDPPKAPPAGGAEKVSSASGGEEEVRGAQRPLGLGPVGAVRPSRSDQDERAAFDALCAVLVVYNGAPPQPLAYSSARQRQVRARLREGHHLEDFGLAVHGRWLLEGRPGEGNPRDRRSDPDWILKAGRFSRYVEAARAEISAGRQPPYHLPRERRVQPPPAGPEPGVVNLRDLSTEERRRMIEAGRRTYPRKPGRRRL